MKRIRLGTRRGTREPFHIPLASFDTHWHLIGGTGKGKTTAIHTLLHGILLDPLRQPCVVIVDRLGGLSTDLRRWFASEYCTEDLRARLVYVEPAREDVVLGFNPLTFESDAHAFYKVALAAETVLRGWAAQNLSDMPRLARWLFNSFFACALLGLTIADSVHLLLPGSEYHRPLLAALPPQLRYEWAELLQKSGGQEISRMLESARNRLKPYYESPILRRMFGTTCNQLQMSRFMQQGNILLLNLAPGNRLPEQVADAIGGLVIHEVLTTARSQPLGSRWPTYVFLDEFQRFISPDMEAAIPEVRQLGIKLLLSHQSLGQLQRGDTDLTSLIFQCQSRMIFGVQGEDADLLAHELASIRFDPYRIKDELYSHRQRLVGHTIRHLASWSQNDSSANSWVEQFGRGWQQGGNIVHGRWGDVRSDSAGQSGQRSQARGKSESHGASYGTHEQLVPIHEDFLELTHRTYLTFDEDKQVCARELRNAPRGRAVVRVVDQPHLSEVDVHRSAPGHLGIDLERLQRQFPEVWDDVLRLLERNFSRDLFLSPSEVDREATVRLQRLLQPVGTLGNAPWPPPASDAHPPETPPGTLFA